MKQALLPALPRGRATTANLGVVYPFMAGSTLGSTGIYIGDDKQSGGGAFCFDPFDLYQRQILSSPNMLVMGQLGYGKSAFVKTFIARSVGLLSGRNGQPRRAAILDPKGEYKHFAELMGMNYLKLAPGGMVRLNPLDAGVRIGANANEIAERRMTLVTALASDVAHRSGRFLKLLERSVLAMVCQIVTENEGLLPPTLHDVVNLLLEPTQEMCSRVRRTKEEFVRDTEDLRFSLVMLLEGPLRGMFDGQSNMTIDWNSRGVVVDLSAVKDNEEVLSLVMICASSWLDAVMTRGASDGSGSIWYQVMDEGWAMIGSTDRVKNYQSKQKLARAYGFVNMLILHRLSDLLSQADSGTTAAKIAEGILADTQTRVIFHQDSDTVPMTQKVLNLSNREAALIPGFGKGEALWKVGAHSAHVQGRIAQAEWAFADTDASMKTAA
jgi:type IV secretory pathway VirB4 component